jgi:hypothetical protein
MSVSTRRIFALLLAVSYVVASGFCGEGWQFVVTVVLGALIPLALIWFPEEIDNYFRTTAIPGLSPSASPGWLVAAMGWVLLAGIPMFVFLRR